MSTTEEAAAQAAELVEDAIEETVNDEILQAMADFKKRLEDCEAGGCGYYAPTNQDEQRRVWVFEMVYNSEYFHSMDEQIRAMQRACDWLKSGRLPRVTKLVTEKKEQEEDTSTVIQLVKE